MFIWLTAQKNIGKCNQSTKIFICSIWFLFFASAYCYFFSELRLVRSGSLFLFPDGDEVRYFNAVKNGTTDITYGSFDVSVFYQAFIWLIKIMTLDGDVVQMFYFFNIFCLLFGNIFLSLAIQKISSLDVGFSSFLLLAVVPEGYFWALTLYKELLIYLMITLCFYLYASGKLSRYLHALTLIGFFRPIFVGLAGLELFNNTQKINLLGKVFWLILISVIFLFIFDSTVIYLSLFFNSERWDSILNAYGMSWMLDSRLLYFLIPLLMPFIIFCLFIFLAFQPSLFFINTASENYYLTPWSDLIFSANLTLPFISLYLFKSSMSFFKSFSKDIFYRISFLYCMFISISFLFMTLRHRFIVTYIIIAGSLVMWGKIKNHSLKLSNSNYFMCFLFGVLCSLLVGLIKA